MNFAYRAGEINEYIINIRRHIHAHPELSFNEHKTTAYIADRLEEIKTTLEAMGAEVVTLAFDVRDAEAATKAIASLGEGWQEIDVLINNAGLALGLDKEYEGDPTDWNTMIDTNIKGLLTMTRLVVPGMVARNRGHVINIGRQRVIKA